VTENPRICHRCGTHLFGWTMSKFNTEILCMDCKGDEVLAPGYAQASDREDLAVRAGHYNFGGVGLSDADRAFLAARRAARVKP